MFVICLLLQLFCNPLKQVYEALKVSVVRVLETLETLKDIRATYFHETHILILSNKIFPLKLPPLTTHYSLCSLIVEFRGKK